MNIPAWCSAVAPPAAGPRSGRRPGYLGAHGHAQERRGAGEEAIAANAELLDLTDSQVRVAVRYYGAFTDEIDRRIALNNEDADEAEAAWQREQAALG